MKVEVQINYDEIYPVLSLRTEIYDWDNAAQMVEYETLLTSWIYDHLFEQGQRYLEENAHCTR